MTQEKIEPTETSTTNAPVKKWGTGEFEVAKWQQEGQYGEFHRYSLQKSKFVNEKWIRQAITSLDAQDLLKISLLLAQVANEEIIK